MPITTTPIEDNPDKFNILVENALLKNDCCCDNVYLKKLTSLLLFRYEIERYYSFEDTDDGNFIDIRYQALNQASLDILDSVNESTITTGTITTRPVSYSELQGKIFSYVRKESKLGTKECWCDVLKTSLAFQLLHQNNSSIYDVLTADNKDIIDNIYSQSTSVYVPPVLSVPVKHQYLT